MLLSAITNCIIHVVELIEFVNVVLCRLESLLFEIDQLRGTQTIIVANPCSLLTFKYCILSCCVICNRRSHTNTRILCYLAQLILNAESDALVSLSVLQRRTSSRASRFTKALLDTSAATVVLFLPSTNSLIINITGVVFPRTAWPLITREKRLGTLHRRFTTSLRTAAAAEVDHSLYLSRFHLRRPNGEFLSASHSYGLDLSML